MHFSIIGFQQDLLYMQLSLLQPIAENIGIVLEESKKGRLKTEDLNTQRPWDPKTRKQRPLFININLKQQTNTLSKD